MIWFNPWQHQFEETPLVALLQEIRRHFGLAHKAFDETAKAFNVGLYTIFDTLGELGKVLSLPVPSPSAKDVLEHSREYEAERFSTRLSSQRFREFFEKAIEQKIGATGRMVIFIDDLDRCEGIVAYRLLESLKLYLNARNCIYVLGLDHAQLEETIARVLSGREETERYRSLARDYLRKMFQNLFLLPVPQSMEEYLRLLLDPNDVLFKNLLTDRFGLAEADWPVRVITTLDQNLPHNPRQVKAFISAWKTYLALLASQRTQGARLDWRLTLILNYLGQLEEPLLRKVEESPAFYIDQILSFCQKGESAHPLFVGLELPYELQKEAAAKTGRVDWPLSTRILWIAQLLKEVDVVEPEIVWQHLLGARGPLPSLRQDKNDGDEKP